MRILDKYLLREFGWPLLYCFDAFVMLWIVGDLFNHLEDFIEARARLGAVARFYLTIFPEMFVQILPVTLLLALLFCLANLARHNELTAMRAGGLSRTRLMAPLLAVGLAASLLVWWVNEQFVPGAQARAMALLDAMRGRPSKHVLVNFFHANPAAGFDLYAREFDPRAGLMQNPELHEQNPDGTPRRAVYAERAIWRDQRWWFSQADIHDFHQHPPLITRAAETNFPVLTDSPRRLALAAQSPRDLTTAELRRFIRAKRRDHDLSRLAVYEVALHERFAFPWMCLIVVWIGIPLGMQIGRSGPLRSVGFALALVVAYYFFSQVARALGATGWLSPPVAAWSTHLLLLGLGAVLLRRLP